MRHVYESLPAIEFITLPLALDYDYNELMSKEGPMNRRRFFRAGLSELLKPLANTIAPLEQMARQLGEIQASINSPVGPKSVSTKPQAVLRPPGALDEEDFIGTCSRSGECVRACPAKAIKIDPAAKIGGGAPYIVAAEMPCVVCTTLECMNVCTSGALALTVLNDIDMGSAEVNHDLCVRSKGEDCKICVEKCPLGTAAIDVVDGNIKVKIACIGCGVCEQACPTTPESIVVIPRSIRA